MEWKGPVEFHRDGQSPSGLSYSCKPCAIKRSREHAAKNAVAVKIKKRQRYITNREAILSKQREYGAANREKISERARRWRLNNVDRRRLLGKAKESRRRAAKRMSGGSHSVLEWAVLVSRYGYACVKCGTPGDASSLTRDHVVPIAKGGSDNIENIQPMCLKCNLRKHVGSTDYRVEFHLDW